MIGNSADDPGLFGAGMAQVGRNWCFSGSGKGLAIAVPEICCNFRLSKSLLYVI